MLSRTKIDRNLAAAQRKTLVEWLLERSSQPTGALVKAGLEELGFWEDAGEPSHQSINEWLKGSFRFEIQRRVLQASSQNARLLTSGVDAEDMDQANMNLLRQTLLEMQLAAAEGMPLDAEVIERLGGTFTRLAKVQLDRRSLDHDARKIALLEKAAAERDAAKAVAGDAALTPEQKEAKMRGIFGMS